MRINEVDQSVLSEISLGSYTKKATLGQAGAQMSKAFGHDRSPEKMAKLDREIANRGKGLERAKARSDKAMAAYKAKSQADAEAHRIANRDANAARLAQLEKEFDPDYEYSDHHSHWAKHKDIAQQIAHLKHAIREAATMGATSAANIGTVDAPQLSPGKARGKKSYTGSMTTGSGTKAPPQPKVVQPKNKDGTAKNGLDIKGANLFGGGTVKRS